MNGWFMIVFTLLVIEMGAAMAMDGKEKTGKYSFFTTFTSHTVLLVIIYMAVKTGF